MNDTTKYIHDAIICWVWSGFYSQAEVNSMIDDALEEGADEKFLRASVAPEFARKRVAERGWPTYTDCDRLDEAFIGLDKVGVLALQNAGYTMSDGHADAREAISDKGGDRYFGYCFYHGQDLERAVAGGGLTIAFDHVDGDVPDKEMIGRSVVAELEKVGLRCDWNGDVNRRITIPKFDWKKRSKGSAGSSITPDMSGAKKPWWKIF